jgi:hypothetical protein
MLTTVAPAFNRATLGQLSPQLAAALSQAMFNCNQPLEQRGPVAFSNGFFPQKGGVLSQQGWNPSDYPGLFPSQQGFIEAPGNGGYRAGDWYSTFYGSPNFDLRTELTQNLNQYYSGPTVTIEGDTQIQNLTTENQYVTNLTVDTINGEPVAGRDGPAGPQGDRGLDGGFYVIPIYGGRLDPPAPDDGLQARVRRLEGLMQGVFDEITRLDRRLKDLKIVGWPQGQDVLEGATFDDEACTVTEDKKPVQLRITGNR